MIASMVATSLSALGSRSRCPPGCRTRASIPTGTTAVIMLGLATVMALILAGCSTGNGGAHPGASKQAKSRSTSSTSAPVASSIPADAQAIAQASLLTLSDFPTGWGQAAAATTASGFSGGAKFAACLGLPSALVSSSTPAANSPTFTPTPATVSVNERVVAYPTTARSKAFFAAIESKKAPGCMSAMFQELTASPTAAHGAGQSSPSLAPFTATRIPLAKYGDGSTEIRLTTSYTASSGPVSLFITIIVIEEGPLNAFVTLTSSLSPPSAKLNDSLATAAARRMRAAERSAAG